MRRLKLGAAVLLAVLAIASSALASPREEVRGTINEHRVPDCDRLASTNDQLIADAKAHSRQMAAVGSVFHSVLDAVGWSLVGEVVGTGSSWGQVVDALFRSAEHRHILEDCRYDKVAVGIYFAPDGTVWLTGRLYGG
jgi:uncharacterized protein YkwD